MRLRTLSVLIAASCALAACGGAKKQPEPVPPDLAAPPTAQQRSSESPADQLPALMAELSRRARTRAVTATEVQGAVAATCAKGTSASLKAFIRERLPDVDVAAAALFGRVVALIDAQCPLAPGQVLSLQSAALAELSLNGMRASTRGAIPERELNDRACAVMVAADRSVPSIVDGLAQLATSHGLQRRRALDIGVKAIVQACPFWIGDLRRSIVPLRRL
jgi:predicted small lipoprotein YifL